MLAVLTGCTEDLERDVFECLDDRCGADAEFIGLECTSEAFAFGARPPGSEAEPIESRLDVSCSVTAALTVEEEFWTGGNTAFTLTFAVNNTAQTPPFTAAKDDEISIQILYVPVDQVSVDATLQLRGQLSTGDKTVTLANFAASGEGFGEQACGLLHEQDPTADLDCDGAVGEADCDDNNFGLRLKRFDFDCDGSTIYTDCDDRNAAVASTEFDADCDSIPTGLDCDDNDASLLAASGDRDCDGILAAMDCDDNDVTATSRVNDADCDGVVTDADCDDADASASVKGVSGACETFELGGTITGLPDGVELTLSFQDGSEISASNSYVAPNSLQQGANYGIVIVPPDGYDGVCTVVDSEGTVVDGNITVPIFCSDVGRNISVIVTGLIEGNSVGFTNHGDELVVGENGAHSFAVPVADGAPYLVSLLTEPGPAPQRCTVTNAAGTVAEGLSSVQVACVPGYRVHGRATGIAWGQALTLQLNGSETIVLPPAGDFAFASVLLNNQPYEVFIESQPTQQTCTLSQDTGTIQAADVEGLEVLCTSAVGTIGGHVAGLLGSALTLELNTVSTVTIEADGGFLFGPLSEGMNYSVAVVTAPTNPSQTCTVTNGSGTKGGSLVDNIAVTCVLDVFEVGGQVTGLPADATIELTNREGGATLLVAGSGPFAFQEEQQDLTSYDIVVSAQPTDEQYACFVADASGEIDGQDVETIRIVCSDERFAVTASVQGLIGSGLVLNNGGDDALEIESDGRFTFEKPLVQGATYAVTVTSAPTGPTQHCTLTNASGVIDSSSETVVVFCGFSVGGTVAGLNTAGLVLANNVSEELSVFGDGVFMFPGSVAQGGDYDVTVAAQPNGQTCRVENGNGIIAAANVGDVVVACEYPIAVTVAGLAGSGLVLQNNGADDLPVDRDGTFEFSAAVANLEDYVVTVQTQPTEPVQQCVVSDAFGTIDGVKPSDITVVCSFALDLTVTGLAGTVVFTNTHADSSTEDLSFAENGTRRFATPLADASTFSVAVKTQPSDPEQVCAIVGDASGSIDNENEGLNAACGFTVGGIVSGLSGTVVLELEQASGTTSERTLSANGAFLFDAVLTDETEYSVRVTTQPANEECTVSPADGTIANAKVSDIAVSCLGTSFSVSGAVTGLGAGLGGVTLTNGGDELVIETDGGFAFPAQDNGSAYEVEAESNQQTCAVTGGAGTIVGADITDVAVDCTPTPGTVTIAALTGITGNTTGIRVYFTEADAESAWYWVGASTDESDFASLAAAQALRGGESFSARPGVGYVDLTGLDADAVYWVSVVVEDSGPETNRYALYAPQKTRTGALRIFVTNSTTEGFFSLFDFFDPPEHPCVADDNLPTAGSFVPWIQNEFLSTYALAPGKSYVRLDGTDILSTGAFAVEPAVVEMTDLVWSNAISATAQNVWTGFAVSGGLLVEGEDCDLSIESSWQSTEPDAIGHYGLANETGLRAYSEDTALCTSERRIYCVEQAVAD